MSKQVIEPEITSTEPHESFRESFITAALRPNLNIYVYPDDTSKVTNEKKDTDNRSSQ